MEEYFWNHECIYTDGSKWQDGSTSAAIYIANKRSVIAFKLNPSHDIVGAELFAILMALRSVNTKDIETKYVILTDSQSALYIISNTDNPSYKVVTYEIHLLLQQRPNVSLQWTRAHCGIKGNEIADRAANMGHGNSFSCRSQMSKEENCNLINKCFTEHWRKNWKCSVILSNKGKFLSNLQKNIPNNSWITMKSRRIETAIARLRIGHVGVNSHLHRFEMRDSPLCAHCVIPETVEHFIMRCPKYSRARQPLKQLCTNLGIQFTLENVLAFGDYPLSTLKLQLDGLADFLRESGRLKDM